MNKAIEKIRSTIRNFITEGNLLLVSLVTLALAIGAGFGALYVGELVAPMRVQQAIGWTVMGLTASVVLFLAGLEVSRKLK